VTDLVDPPKVPKYRARTLSVDELRAVYRHVAGHRRGPLWICIGETGARFGEAAGLRRADVDRNAMVVRIAEAKTDAGRREIPITRRLLAALDLQEERVRLLRLLAGDRWEEHGLVFPNSRGRPLREDHVLTEWHAVLREIGLEGEGKPSVRMHDLRHSKGTLMADEGEDLVVIQRTLGHAKSSITADLYIGKVPKALRRAAERWETLLGEEAAASPNGAPEPVP
jgi:integrase